ncbi:MULTISPECIES: hypothetical protein [Bacillus]|uniref:7, 8-dihydropterin-6-yl-methyl-4-(Beta-D-ribofuranosyl)aminobenzene 5'-phosphate synthase n=1 Tax=Bacillus capparidis TaxID=1840411 RepID=A0ABS4CXK3_9BACI|nr:MULTISPECIES: hypothetical protein [Bacillus]MBP1082093.1 7,8-dihydropterin-6-yl-methyl-4-(beta-D-ribofuranosyl)aminobenzene 5'-phosphate synthase [Bacillus capparidis]MED1096717.1 hypothetical protein [Bacillus capparidis]
MKFRATVLSENSVFGNLGAIAEHGWAVFLETNHGNYLFDTGQERHYLIMLMYLKKIYPALKESYLVIIISTTQGV